jgi:hypothetical protein
MQLGLNAAAELDVQAAKSAADTVQAMLRTHSDEARSAMEVNLEAELENFYRHLRSAEARGQSLESFVGHPASNLRRQVERLFAESAFEAVRRRAEENVRREGTREPAGMPVLALCGRPAYASLPAYGNSTRLELQEDHMSESRRNVLTTLVVIMSVLAVSVARRSGATAGLLRSFWPEGLLIAGMCWWLLLPGWLLGLGAMCVGVGARAVWVMRVLTRAGRPTPVREASSVQHSAGSVA